MSLDSNEDDQFDLGNKRGSFDNDNRKNNDK